MNNVFKNKYSKIVLGILWGLGLACIFRQACNGRNCIIYKAPNKVEVNNKIFQKNKKCYKYKAENTKCTDDADI